VGKQAAKEAAAKARRRRNAAMKAEAKRKQEAQFFADLESGTTTRIRTAGAQPLDYRPVNSAAWNTVRARS